ncbi:MAG TPA: cobalamin B12-binding domain-containing protein [Chloroflexota bacterium]|nr:cobalamin B12-binding domain-containing protein [Chloroflexota bacterium]
MSDAPPPPAAPARPETARAALAPPIRVLVAKPGLDGHDRGAKVVARALRDAGMEVVYTGIRQTPATIAEAALQEDAEAVGLSILSGAHLTLVPRVLEELRARGLDDVVLWVGGIIPAADVPALRALGVAAVFGPGSPMADTVQFVQEAVAARRAASGAPRPSAP